MAPLRKALYIGYVAFLLGTCTFLFAHILWQLAYRKVFVLVLQFVVLALHLLVSIGIIGIGNAFNRKH